MPQTKYKVKDTSIHSKTQKYYEEHADQYFKDTSAGDISALYKPFLMNVPSGGLILDAGSGSGRDTLAFKKLGYRVEAFDLSPRLAELSTKLTGIRTKVAGFKDLNVQ